MYNLGHRNPDVIASLSTARNPRHRQPSFPQHGTCRADRTPDRRHARCPLRGLCQWRREAIDVAIKSARRATGRRRVVSVVDAYHGHTGLALAAGDEQAANAFLATEPDFVRVAFNDIDALDAALAEPTAAVILETVPATAGFPRPDPSICQPCASSAIRPAPCTSPTRCRPASAAAGRCGRWITSAWCRTSWSPARGCRGHLPDRGHFAPANEAGAWIESDGWSHVRPSEVQNWGAGSPRPYST